MLIRNVGTQSEITLDCLDTLRLDHDRLLPHPLARDAGNGQSRESPAVPSKQVSACHDLPLPVDEGGTKGDGVIA